MKIRLLLCAVLFTGASLLSGLAQSGPGGGSSPRIGGAMLKLFGENKNFSATLEVDSQKVDSGDQVKVSGKITLGDGKTRFEMSIDNVKNDRLTPEAVAQMKSIGLNEFIFISRPDKKIVYQVFPGLQSYADMPFKDQDDPALANRAKMEATELGKESLAGHPCVKNKVIITTEDGKTTESTVWNATDLKNFPVKIERTEDGRHTALTFINLKLGAAESKSFEPPADYTHYNNPQDMMREAIAKHFGNGTPPKP